MPSALDYRRRLLAIVNAFLDPADSMHERAHRLVHRLYHDPRRRGPMTLDELVWGGFISELTDSEFYGRSDYLHETRETLLHGSPVLHRTYVNYDWRPDFSDVEREWYGLLAELEAWLSSGSLTDDEVAHAEYKSRIETIASISGRTPTPGNTGSESIHHYIMRTASTVLTGIDPGWSDRAGYPAAAAPMTILHWDPSAPTNRDQPPDATDSIAWARRALAAITLHGWVWITCQITAKAYLISLH